MSRSGAGVAQPDNAQVADQQITRWVLVVLAIGVAVRFWGLDSQSFWMDEVIALNHTAAQSLYALLTGFRDTHPPLYFALLHAWVGNFGASEIATRLPSAIAGSLAIPVLYFGARSTTGSFAAGIGSILLATSSFSIYQAQNARPYALLLLLASLLTVYWLRIVQNLEQDQLRVRSLMLLSALCALTTFVHYFGLVLAFSLWLYLSFRALRLRRHMMQVVLWGVVSALPVCLYLFHQQSETLFTDPGGALNRRLPIGLRDVISPLRALFSQPAYLVLFLLPLAITPAQTMRNVMSVQKTTSWRLAMLPLLACIVVCYGTAVALGVRASIFLMNKNLVIIFPAVYLLAGLYLSEIGRLASGNGIRLVTLICVACLASFLATGYPLFQQSYYAPHRSQYREAMADLTRAMRPGDRVGYSYHLESLIGRLGFHHYGLADVPGTDGQSEATPLPITNPEQTEVVLALIKDARKDDASVHLLDGYTFRIKQDTLQAAAAVVACIALSERIGMRTYALHTSADRCRPVPDPVITRDWRR